MRVASAVVAVSIVLATAAAPAWAVPDSPPPSADRAAPATTQQRVHAMGHHVMPFDLAKTRHVFAMTDDGGVQRVRVRDAKDSDQIPLIRSHLAHEADAFARGDFGDPSHLHGASMPGLADLTSHAAQLRVTYAPLPDGGEIRYASDDRHLVTAIHRWFGAQLSEHGADAEIE